MDQYLPKDVVNIVDEYTTGDPSFNCVLREFYHFNEFNNYVEPMAIKENGEIYIQDLCTLCFRPGSYEHLDSEYHRNKVKILNELNLIDVLILILW